MFEQADGTHALRMSRFTHVLAMSTASPHGCSIIREVDVNSQLRSQIAWPGIKSGASGLTDVYSMLRDCKQVRDPDVDH